MTLTVHHGDSREVLKSLPDGSVDSVCTDPPYALVSIQKRFGKSGAADLHKASRPKGEQDPYVRAAAGFMGQAWDTGETAFSAEFWAEAFRVLKPGAHLIAFSGTRTYHRLACAIEDAGFEVRDQLAWVTGSGFPKSHNQTGKWEGWGTALKPAWEPIVLARKPLIGTVAQNLAQHGTGALNIDGCRVESDGEHKRPFQPTNNERGVYGAQSGFQPTNAEGRWPANVVHDGSEEVVGAFPETTSNSTGQGGERGLGYMGGAAGSFCEPRPTDAGSAARFFYSAKADAEDRLGSKHPTVKPVDLMRWLVRLVTPPGGTVLDPFAGTGSTGLACMAEGFDCILIEREEQYVADINRRIAWAKGEGRLTAQEKARQAPKPADDLPLFGGEAA